MATFSAADRASPAHDHDGEDDDDPLDFLFDSDTTLDNANVEEAAGVVDEMNSRLLDFIRGADLLIFDAQYSLAESTSVKEDWGHSSNVVGVELALLGDVHHLTFFHHEPLNDNERLDQIVHEAQRIEEIMRTGNRKLKISGAYDGMDLTL